MYSMQVFVPYSVLSVCNSEGVLSYICEHVRLRGMVFCGIPNQVPCVGSLRVGDRGVWYMVDVDERVEVEPVQRGPMSGGTMLGYGQPAWCVY